MVLAAGWKCFQRLFRRIKSRQPPPNTSPQTTEVKSSRKISRRPPTLKINTPQQPQQTQQPIPGKLKATTTVVPKAGGLYQFSKTEGLDDSANPGVRKRGGSLTVGKIPGNTASTPSKSVGDGPRRGSLQQPRYARGVSVGSQDTKGANGMSYTPKVFKNGPLTLEYNRYLMKKPSSLASSTPTPTGDSSNLKQGSCEESYIPQIVSPTRSWPSLLARNFFRLTNIKLILTFLINVILLTYQVSEHNYHVRL